METTKFFSGDIITTEDGSYSLCHSALGDSYHSCAGALLESEHIYINCGLKQLGKSKVCVFEMGLGTGLNMLLTLKYAIENHITIDYHAVELYPLDMSTIEQLDYSKFCSREVYQLFIEAHKADWNITKELHTNFSISKYNSDITNIQHFPKGIDLVYYDAFSPDTQPQLWTSNIFSSLASNMTTGGILMTYSSRGTVKTALREAGFQVKRLIGPGSKRHIVRAIIP